MLISTKHICMEHQNVLYTYYFRCFLRRSIEDYSRVYSRYFELFARHVYFRCDYISPLRWAFPQAFHTEDAFISYKPGHIFFMGFRLLIMKTISPLGSNFSATAKAKMPSGQHSISAPLAFLRSHFSILLGILPPRFQRFRHWKPLMLHDSAADNAGRCNTATASGLC